MACSACTEPDKSDGRGRGPAVRHHTSSIRALAAAEHCIFDVRVRLRLLEFSSFEAEKLVENASTLIDVVIKAKPAASKGTYLKKIFISTTMGPSIRIDPVGVSQAA